MAVIFLDPDDEITTAISRLRASQDIKVALVLPPGSRLGTSRINFRLLAREAQELPRQAAVVTTEAGVRAIAVSAGLPAYASVSEYEAAIVAAAGAAGGSATTAAAAAIVATDPAPATADPAPATADLAPPAADPAPARADLAPPAPVAAEATAATAGAVAAAELAPATSDAAESTGDAGVDAAAGLAAAAVVGTAAKPKRSRSRKAAGTQPEPVSEAGPDPDAATVVTAAAVAGLDASPASGAAPEESAAAEPRPEATQPDPATTGAAPATAAVPVPEADDAATGVDDAATAAAAFEAEVASVPPPPRSPGPRSSAALPVVAGPVHATGIFGRRGGLLGVVAIVAAAGLLVVALAVFVLPQATITVAAPIESVGPVTRTVTADPSAVEPDPVAGVIPAELVTIPLSAEGEFTATGVKVTETKAKGSVTFSNLDATAVTTVPSGSVVSTDSNVRFRTLATIRVPRAKYKGFTIDPGRASVRVEAVKAGPNGNVQANAIQNVPSGFDPIVLRVTNPSETSGGKRTESTRVAQEDVDVAVAELTRELDDQLAAALADESTAPEGTTLVKETATTSAVKARPAVDNLVGRNVSSFSLALTADGRVIAVDTGVLDPLAAEALSSAVPEGAVLFPESVRTTVGSPTVDGGVVSFEVGATGQAWRPLDPATLLTEVKGSSVLEAEDALAEFGDVTIDVWPFYVATIPDNDRVTLTVVPPTPSGP